MYSSTGCPIFSDFQGIKISWCNVGCGYYQTCSTLTNFTLSSLRFKQRNIETSHRMFIFLIVLTNRVCHSSAAVLNPSLHSLTLQQLICYNRSHSPEKRFIINFRNSHLFDGYWPRSTLVDLSLGRSITPIFCLVGYSHASL